MAGVEIVIHRAATRTGSRRSPAPSRSPLGVRYDGPGDELAEWYAVPANQLKRIGGLDDIFNNVPSGREHRVMAAIRGAGDRYHEGGAQCLPRVDLIDQGLDLRDELGPRTLLKYRLR
jgi:hypothetical protein